MALSCATPVSASSRTTERRRRSRGAATGPLLAACIALAPVHLDAQPASLAALRTTAERSDYEQTTRHADVVSFLEAVATADDVHLTRLGYTAEGRRLPLLVWGAPDASPEAVRATGKVRVYLQGNIHGGEVCGKEALLQLARSLALDQHRSWAEELVLLVAPLYNADGNERIDVRGRARQHGPFAGVGQRGNARGFDLNRDHIKLDTPEARALARLMRDYDPHVYVDFHTTNGTYHAYHLTYSPPLHPSTAPPLVDLLRHGLLPAATRRIETRRGWHTYYYGNLPPPHQGNLSWTGLGDDAGWYTFDHRPRFSNNYAGLRNRLGILSEAYSYATFRERVEVSLAFAEEILDYLATHADHVRATLADADAASVVGQRLALRARHRRSEEPVRILGGAVIEEPNPFSSGTVLRRTDVIKPVTVYEYGSFEASETETVPRAYLIPAAQRRTRDLLVAHGIAHGELPADTVLVVERFHVDSTHVAEKEYEGHHETQLFGRYTADTTAVPAGTVIVPVAQALGRLAFVLLEPRSDDGVATWDLIDSDPAAGDSYPILRLSPEP